MKKWLTENKLYIELLSSILIGIAAVMVSYASYIVSKQQLLLTEISLQPHFYIETNPRFDRKKDSYVEKELYIFNTGAPINNSNFMIKSFLIVDHELNGNRLKTHLPIIGYYPVQFNHQVSTGKLVTFMGYLNIENFSRLFIELQKENVKKRYGFVNIHLEHIVVVEYKNRKGVLDNAYFIDRELVEKSKVLEKLEIHRKIFPVEIEALTAEQLMNKVAEYEKNNKLLQ